MIDENRIITQLLQMLAELGWELTPAECMRIFVGKAVKDEHALIEARTGQPLTEDWMVRFRERRNVRLMNEVQAIEGALDAVKELHRRLDGRIACASGADLPKVLMQLEKCGLLPYFEGRVFSGHDLPRSKPTPRPLRPYHRSAGSRAGQSLASHMPCHGRETAER